MYGLEKATKLNHEKLKSLRILAVSHVTHGYGCAQALESYFLKIGGDYTLITHPLYGTNEFQSKYRHFKQGILSHEVQGVSFCRSEYLRYIKDAFTTFIWGWRGKPYHLFIGMNCLVGFSGVLLRWMGRVQKVVYYTADYSGQRFENPVLNKIYEWCDKFVVKHADLIWNVSHKIEQRRWEQGAPQNKTMVVPNTVDFSLIPNKPIDEKERKLNFVYIGGLNEGYGLEEFIDLLPWIFQNFPSFSVDIIGGGVLGDKIREKAASLGHDDKINFLGYKPYDEALAFLSRSSIGFAPYAADLEPEHYLRYCDPSKVKAYMACGCSVIIRNIPELAQLIAERKAGWVYETKEDLKAILQEVFSNKDKVEQYRKNALECAAQFDNNKVFDQSFSETFQRLGWD